MTLAQTADDQWHYEHGGRWIGPVDRASVIGLIQQGVIRPDTLLCLGQGEWIPATKSELSFLFSRSQRAPWFRAVTSPFVLILSINIIVFLVMVASGIGLLEPKAEVLLNWGANFGPKTTSGEWWRLLTSMFVHIGLLHLVFNMFVLIQIGPLMQSLMGRVRFTMAYFVSGLAGSLTSLAWNPYVVSAGASGAIFGLYGALLGFSIVHHGKVPTKVMSNLVGSAILFIGYNVVYGLLRPGTDMAAHVGGLVGGFIFSAAICAAMPSESRTRTIRRTIGVSAGTAILMVATAIALPHTINLDAKIKQFAEVESRTLDKFNAAALDLRVGKIKAADFANLMERDVLPGWIAERDSMSRLKGLPQRQERVVTLLVKYMELRREAFTDFAEGMRENQKDKLQNAAKKQREAEQVSKEIGNLSKSR